MMQTIEHYTNYREFLRDYYMETKKKFPFFSYRFFCKKAGISSPSLYRDVEQGKRNLTPKTILSFVQGFGFNDQEGGYFTALVHFNQAESSRDKQKYLEQMRGLLPKVKPQIVPVHQYAYYSRWYNIAIRELACLMDWKENYSVLAKSVHPPIKKTEAREAMRLLLEMGLLEKRADGTYVQTQRHITTGPEVVSVAVRSVNRQLAELGMNAIEELSPEDRDISSLTMGISRKTYQVLKHEIQDFKAKIVRMVANQDPAEDVYNLNVQLFPLSRRMPEGKA